MVIEILYLILEEIRYLTSYLISISRIYYSGGFLMAHCWRFFNELAAPNSYWPWLIIETRVTVVETFKPFDYCSFTDSTPMWVIYIIDFFCCLLRRQIFSPKMAQNGANSDFFIIYSKIKKCKIIKNISSKWKIVRIKEIKISCTAKMI